jgi:Raf kinase inhibitor-like YbhB/YbcL family protein
MAFTLTSTAFRDGTPLPNKYTADGEGVSPPLAWSGAPEGTRSFVVVCEDPDAPSGTFRHWALFNIPGSASRLDEGEGNRELSQSGVNDLGEYGYGSPGPPRGHGPHHYHFRLAALDVETIDPPRNARVTDIWRIANKHLLGVAETVGTYER